MAQTWQPIGPKPIVGAQAFFVGTSPIATPTYSAAGRVTAIAADSPVCTADQNRTI